MIKITSHWSFSKGTLLTVSKVHPMICVHAISFKSLNFCVSLFTLFLSFYCKTKISCRLSVKYSISYHYTQTSTTRASSPLGSLGQVRSCTLNSVIRGNFVFSVEKHSVESFSLYPNSWQQKPPFLASIIISPPEEHVKIQTRALLCLHCKRWKTNVALPMYHPMHCRMGTVHTTNSITKDYGPLPTWRPNGSQMSLVYQKLG